MQIGHFYFLHDNYFIDFPDPDLQKNKKTVDGKPHGRPCFFAFMDTIKQIYWMVPISSRVEKYQELYQKKIVKYRKSDTLVIGEVMRSKTAFLIKNMCPVIPK